MMHLQGIKQLKELSADLSVLYVEDDTAIRETMGHYLGKFFLKVVIAKDGLEGLYAYQQQTFDLVISDLSMPHLSGIEMLKEIKVINKNQAILITSAHSESEYMFGAIKLGVDGYIVKPFLYEQLNQELFKIVSLLHEYKDNEAYKDHLKNMVEEKTSHIQNMMLFQSQNYEKTLFSIVEMIEQRDSYTAGHSKRVAQYSLMIAKQMGYSEEDCTKLYQAGILHDVGKIATPDAVLLNPKVLNTIEYKLIQEHVQVGYKLLSHIPMFSELAEIIYAHHERHDGKGYPRGLVGDAIGQLSRIMIVADAFDAMTTNRIYKTRKSVSVALEEIAQMTSTQFHPDVVKSALIALKDVRLDESVNQLPITKLEQERFAYFYKDTISGVYNDNYLEVVLLKNTYELQYKYMEIFFIHGFSLYNKNRSWGEGNVLLKRFATALNECSQDSLVFRVFGDDFVLLSKEKLDLENLKVLLDTMTSSEGVQYSTKSIDLTQVAVNHVAQIEHA